MIIEPSRFTEKRLKEIQKINEATFILTERLEIIKQQRQLLERILPTIESRINYKKFQEEYDDLLLLERSLKKELANEIGKILAEITQEKGEKDGEEIVIYLV